MAASLAVVPPRVQTISNDPMATCTGHFTAGGSIKPRDNRWVEKEVKVNPFLSAPKLAIIAENELRKKASPSQQLEMCSIRKISHWKKSQTKAFHKYKRNQKVKREFTKKQENKDFSYWEQALFTDESKFNIFGSDGKPYVWRKSNEELRRQNLKPAEKYGGGSVMVWGSFSAASQELCISLKGEWIRMYNLTF
ncbi:HTH_Tnp_Tc3_2 domain-containing protein [Trichonephila clavipes]|nr:HTH_Tnp_Tc3_2 domain-containing protein [Trichonephila clavipes]